MSGQAATALCVEMEASSNSIPRNGIVGFIASKAYFITELLARIKPTCHSIVEENSRKAGAYFAASRIQNRRGVLKVCTGGMRNTHMKCLWTGVSIFDCTENIRKFAIFRRDENGIRHGKADA
jgi:hypothetical protein